MRIFKTKIFERWTKAIKLKDRELKKALEEVLDGLYEASLGGNLYKKRVSLGNKGKRGGARTIIALKKEKKAFFLYGFGKNKKADIDDKEKEQLKELAKVYINICDEAINKLKEAGKLFEVI